MAGSWGFFAISATCLGLVSSLQINHENVFHDDDLFSFVTMPGVRAPRFNVTVNNAGAISPGYWFVAPYTAADPWDPIEDYKPHQIGPMIYDNNGELVWSGAHLFQDRSVFDFRATQINGKPYLSFIVNYDPGDMYTQMGTAVILDPSYQTYHQLHLPVSSFNMHEFNVIDDGRSALIITSRTTMAPYKPGRPDRKVIDNGFKEVDLATGLSLFEWNALDHLDITASRSTALYTPPSADEAWDYVHLNSVAKSALNGDYLISSRYTDSIYRVSAADGSIVWRFGGSQSDFPVPAEMAFLGQHDARILSEDGSSLTLSFLNNAADDSRRAQPWSSACVVALDTARMTARLLHSYPRPDHATTHGRGNVQVLREGGGGGNVFANWADNAFLSEFTRAGEEVWRAQFASKRYVTYRAYKFGFEGRPLDRPAVVAWASVTAEGALTTVFHVSWNGATEVRTWKFYSCLDDICEKTEEIGSAPREGFETVYAGAGLHRAVFVEAVGAGGAALGESLVVNTTVSVLPVMGVRGGDAEYGVLMPQLLVVSFVAMAVTVFWVLFQRRRRRGSLVVWRDPEKQGRWDSS